MHYQACNGNLAEIEKLEAMNADEYYSTLNRFIRIMKEQNN